MTTVESPASPAALPPHLTREYVVRLGGQVAAAPGAQTASAVAPFTGDLLPAVPQSTPADVVDG